MHIFRSVSILVLITSHLMIIHLHPFFIFLINGCCLVVTTFPWLSEKKTVVRNNTRQCCMYSLSYIYMCCPSGGGPSGRDAQNSFTLHVQTPLFPRVWVSAHFPPPSRRNLLWPRSTDFLRIGCNLEVYLNNHYKHFNKSSASAPLVFADAFFLLLSLSLCLNVHHCGH